jgi:dipeptidase E
LQEEAEMKRLILTSSGLESKKLKDEFLKIIKKPIENNKLMLVAGARTKEELFYVNESLNELIQLGIPKKNIKFINISKDDSINDKNFDVVYVCGGNTYYILDRLRKTGLDKLIKKLVNKSVIYIGVSAGSILAGKSIQIAGWGSEGDPNNVKIKDLNGFNFTNIAIFPHYKNRLKKELFSFRKIVRYPVEPLKNKQAVIIIKNKIKKVK